MALLRDVPFVRWLGNSLVVSVFGCITVVVVSAMAGFAFAKYRFRGERLLFLVVLASMTVPFHMIIVGGVCWRQPAGCRGTSEVAAGSRVVLGTDCPPSVQLRVAAIILLRG